jgi:hypothetical protein
MVSWPGHLGAATDERWLGGPARAGKRHLHRLAWALPEDLLVDRLGFGLGLDAELAPENLHALLVLPERGVPAPELAIEPHQRSVHSLLQRVEGEMLGREESGRGECRAC